VTKEQAVALFDSNWWEGKSPIELAMFQLFEERLCMPFAVFQDAVEAALKRSVWTHEFAYPERLQAELLGDKPKPTLDDILNLIPAEKRLVIAL
jgi:hypothetical protein